METKASSSGTAPDGKAVGQAEAAHLPSKIQVEITGRIVDGNRYQLCRNGIYFSLTAEEIEYIASQILVEGVPKQSETGGKDRYADSVGIAAEAFRLHKERPRNMVGDEHWVNDYARAVQDFRTGNVPDVRRATETGGSSHGDG